MKLNCDDVRDLAPELLTGRLSAAVAGFAREHIAGCAECAGEVELARMLFAGQRLQAPAGLQERVVERIVSQPPAVRWGRLPLAIAAAVALLLLGGREFMLTSSREPGPQVPTASEPRPNDQTGAGWMTVDGALNSGAASLGDLSEEQLRQLLTELES